MKRLLCGFTLVIALAGVAVTSAVAGSGGKGSQTLTATCSVLGTVTVHASNGQSAWVNNTHYVVLTFTGTFTPVSGTPETFTKTYGHKTGFTGTKYTCSGFQTDPSGTFAFTATVAKTPTH
jgi:hypothetical protein